MLAAPQSFLCNRRIVFIASLLVCCVLFGQENTTEIDSIEQLYLSKSYAPNQELGLLSKLAGDSQDPQKKLHYSNALITKATQQDSVVYLFDAYLQQGNAFRLKSDLGKALTSFMRAEKFARDSINKMQLAMVNVTIGDVYSVMGSHNNSVSYYEQGIKTLREIKSDSTLLASALLNAGDEYFNAGKYEKAMNLFYESSLICRKIQFNTGAAYNLGNIGMVYAKQGKSKLAEANINEAISILEKEKDYYPISVYLNYVADIYLDQNNPKQALKFAQKSLDLAQKYGLKDQISDANRELSDIYTASRNAEKAFFHYKEHIKYRDSVRDLDNIEKLANLRTDLEVSKKQVQLDLINQQRENQQVVIFGVGIVLILVSLLALGLFRRNKYISKTRKIVDEERKKSNDLLCNILPEQTAEELKENGEVRAKKYASVTVLFSDFKGFTKYAEALPPEELVKTVDMYFSAFDKIMERHGVEKIKTIGDAYMCASGLPIPSDDHAERVLRAAQDMLAYVKKKQQVHNVDEARFDIRIGVHTGPIVAGVVGKKKFACDIWGDTVNIASRMESSSEPGKINVSATTYELTQSLFNFEGRGEIAIKNRSSIEMYFLNPNS